MRDAWLLTACAIEAGHEGEARALADQAVQLCGWERYDLVVQVTSYYAFECKHLPAGWCYAAVVGRHLHLLVHPDAAEFVMRGSPRLREAIARRPGLQRLDELLIVDLDEADLLIPDDLSELQP